MFLPTRRASVYEPRMSYLYFQMTSLFKWRTCFLPDAHTDVFWYLEVHLQIAEPSKFHSMTDQTLNTVAERRGKMKLSFLKVLSVIIHDGKLQL